MIGYHGNTTLRCEVRDSSVSLHEWDNCTYNYQTQNDTPGVALVYEGFNDTPGVTSA